MTVPATARLVRTVRSRDGAPQVSHEASASASAWAFVREGAMLAVMVAVMGAAALAGHGTAPMLGAALVFAALSFGYAPLARTRAWAREHVVDLWAMVLVMIAQAVGAGASGAAGAGGMAGMAGTTGMAGHGLGATAVATAAASTVTASTTATTAASLTITTTAILLAWLIARAVLARRGWRIHSLVSLVGCGACLAWMLVA
ncbi:hypothetical protein ASE16_16850 [Leifsonia sp. Root227]|uniref:hypothetical protein n=1 Tax=Leifsonia sp. Root227 TaxID=1736496 RepID=UPI0006F9DFD1|nr:hypothetical protein [Leifsonia sp. Root227]KRC47043.1 hypothetical protein ASE16_16850 [Leifsonia sp. Root227]